MVMRRRTCIKNVEKVLNAEQRVFVIKRYYQSGSIKKVKPGEPGVHGYYI